MANGNQDQVSKFFLKSKTIWGGIILGLPPILESVGMGGIGQMLIDLNPDIMGVVDKLADLVGLFLVVWGRIKATGSVTVK